MFMDLIEKFVLSSAGVGLFLLIVARLIPNEKLKAWGRAHGELATKFFGKKLGAGPWRKLEDFAQNSAGVYWAGFTEGLDSDDAPEGKAPSTGNAIPVLILACIALSISGCATPRKVKFLQNQSYSKGLADAYQELEPKVKVAIDAANAKIEDLKDKLLTLSLSEEAALKDRENALLILRFIALNCECDHKSILLDATVPLEDRIARFIEHPHTCGHKDIFGGR